MEAAQQEITPIYTGDSSIESGEAYSHDFHLLSDED